MTAHRFGPRRTHSLAQLRALDDVHQQQVLLAAAAYSGESYAGLDQLAADMEIDHYEIFEYGEARYEMWVVASDNGLVFPLGSPEPTAVHCAQSHFWSVDDDDAAAIALAEALDEIVPF